MELEILAYFMQSVHEIYRSTSLLIWSETNILEMCLYEVSYIIVQYGNAWQEQPPNYLGYCDKVVHVVTKPATSLSEQFNWAT